MPDPEETPGPRKQDLVRRLARPMGVVSGYSPPLADTGMLLVFAAAAATADLQAALGMPGTLIAIIAMVVFGNLAAGVSIATPLLASPWNVIGPGLPPSAALSAARGVVYLGGANLTGPLAVLAVYAAAGTVHTLAATAWRRLGLMTGRGGEADGAAPDAGGAAARAAASAAGRPVSESRTGWDARQAGIPGRRRYQIRVRGRLGPTIRSAFPALRARADGGDTVLTGVLADQAALYGVLAEAEALGLELLEVRRLPPRDQPWAPSS